MLQLVTGTAAVLAVLWLPGLLLLRALRPCASRLRNVALAPAASLGLLMLVGLAADAAGIPVRPAVVLPVVAVVTLLVTVLCARESRSPSTPPLPAAERVVLAVLVIGAAVLWLHASHLAGRVPANDDGTHHGLYAARILATQSLDVHQVAVGDVLGAGPRLGYYPFGLHLAAALVAGLGGIDVGKALVLCVVSLAAVALPLGTCGLARRLFPAAAFAGPAAALLALSFPVFPYYVAYWGGLTMIAGIALVAPMVDALVGASDDGPTWTVGVALGLCAVGLFFLHNSEAVTVAVLSALLVLGPPYGRRWVERLRGTGRAWAVAAVGCVVVLLPVLSELRRGAAERSDVARLHALAPADALDQVLGTFLGAGSLAELVVTALVVVGALLALRRPEALGWLAGLAAFAVLAYLSARRTPLGDALSVPWYGRWDRVVVNLLLPFATLGGLGIAGAVQVVRRVLPRRGLAALVVAGGLVATTVVPSYRADGRDLRLAFDGASLAGPDERAAFTWLARHQRPGERVLNDVTDGSGWMYALAGARPLFAMAVHAFPTGWGDRTYLLAHAADLGGDRSARCAADHWGVRFVYVGPRVFPYRRHALDLAALRHSPSWRLVFARGGAVVLERVVSAGSPGCPARAR